MDDAAPSVTPGAGVAAVDTRPDAPGSSANAAAFDAGADNVFARIAVRYDLLCDIFSLGMHRLWKSAMAREIAQAPGAIVLDAASGTGHIALRVVRRGLRQSAAAKTVIASDICPEMLAVARAKSRRMAAAPDFRIADVHRLEGFADSSVDIYAIAFAMKICDRHKVLDEACRVLKPGGALRCMEASHIPASWLRTVYLRYMDWCLPFIAWAATGGDRSAYNYLLRGIHVFPDQHAFADEIGVTASNR